MNRVTIAITISGLFFYTIGLSADLPKNMVIGPHLVECDGCARLRNLIFSQVRVHGHIDACDCEFDTLDASGYVRLISTRVKQQVACRGELSLRESICAKVCAMAELITLENAHIDELIVELLVKKNKKSILPKVVLLGTSSIGRITFVHTTGSVVIKNVAATVGSVIDGTVLTQLPKDQK